jgi:DNA-binding IclR family transcriptional regulator
MRPSTSVADKEQKSSIQVIERMISLLDALARQSAPVNLKQLAAETALHPSTAHRILSVMVQNQIVDRIEPGTYRLGMRLLELGTLVRSRISIRQEALPFMQELHRELGETVNLSIRRDDEVVYVERTSSGTQMMRVVQIIGARAPLHITAVGKIFLAADGVAKCQEYARRTGLPRFTDNTLTDQSGLLTEIERARTNGYAFDNEEAEKGVSCAGAGIYDDDGNLIAGLSVSAPAERFNAAWGLQVKQMADRISRAIGHQAGTAERAQVLRHS